MTNEKLSTLNALFAGSLKKCLEASGIRSDGNVPADSIFTLIHACLNTPSVVSVVDLVAVKAALAEKQRQVPNVNEPTFEDFVWDLETVAGAAFQAVFGATLGESNENDDEAGAQSREDRADEPQHFLTPGLFLASLLRLDESSIRCIGFKHARLGILAAGVTAKDLLHSLLEYRAEVQKRSFAYEPLGYGTNITAQVEAGLWPDCPLVGMEDLVEEVVCRLASGSACLIGEPGVGKSAFVRGLAWHAQDANSEITTDEAMGWRVVSITRDDFLAGAGNEGDLEQRLKDLLEHTRRCPDVIPFFDEVHFLLDAKDDVGKAVINSLKPRMADGTFRCIAATTDAEYERHIMKDDAMHSRFSPTIIVREPTRVEAIKILRDSLADLMRKASSCGVTIDEPDDPEDEQSGVIPFVVDLTLRYQKNDRLPRKAFRLLQSVINYKVHQVALKRKGVDKFADESATIDNEFVTQIAKRRYGPSVDREDNEFWSSLNEDLAAIAGSDAATSITLALYRGAFGLQVTAQTSRPLARIALLASTPEILSSIAGTIQTRLFGDPAGGYAEDLSRYTDEISRTSLTGAPPGYAGYDESSVFSRIRARSSGGVLHFQNVGTASHHIAAEIKSILLGTAKDSSSRKVDLTQWVVLLTDVASPGTKLKGLWQDPIAKIKPAITPIVIESLDSFGEPTDTVESLVDNLMSADVRLPPQLIDGDTIGQLETKAAKENRSAEDVLEEWFQDYAINQIHN